MISSLFRSTVCRATALAALLVFVHRASGDLQPLIPISAFFDNQSIRQMALSPDGNKIAMIAPNSGRYSIALLDTATGKMAVVVHFNDENIDSLFWKGNDRILFRSSVAGHEIPLLASTDLAGKSVKRILESRRTRDDFSLFFGTLVDRFPASDDHILITGYTKETDGRKIGPSIPRNPTLSVYRVNVETGVRSPVLALDKGVGAGYFNHEVQQRLTAVTEGKEVLVRIRDRNDRPFRTIKTFDPLDVRWDVQGMLADGRTIYLLDSTETDRPVLRSLNLDDGNLSDVLYAPPAGEIARLIFSPKRDRLLGLVVENEKFETVWFDPTWSSLVRSLEAGFPNHRISVPSISDDEKRFLFVASSDVDPGTYYLADRRGEGFRVQPINAVRPAIKPALMSPMTPISFPSRDGLTIHGYLTKPGGQADARTPLIVLPHGGPWARDSWGFNPEVQFLASRGYAVLQVNFRASTGYGRAFREAGDREWGAKMQNDLSDAVAWVVAQGMADKNQIGISGASYGGYAALAGVTMTPELYQVGINYVGVSDLRLITRYDRSHTANSKAGFSKRVGEDAAFLAQRSPVEHVANIRVPTLHAYGRNDPRVEFSHWEVLESALKKHGKTYEVLIEEDEGHGFAKEETSDRFYGAVEAFLAKHMPSERLKAGVRIGEAKVIEMPATPAGG